MTPSAGEDHIGGSVFIDARAIAGAGPLVAQGIMRGTIYFDLDCTDTDDRDKLCGESDSSDHPARRGWEIEARVGFTPRGYGRRVGGYGGVRYFVTWTDTRVEHGALVTLGGLAW